MSDDRFMQFARNQRWGTCVACPCVEGHVYPELCPYTYRSDHHLDLDQLVELFKWEQRERRVT